MTAPRFLVDECTPFSLAQALRDRGFDVRHVGEGWPGLSDKEVLDVAARESRIVVTTDRDYGLLVVRLAFRIDGVVLLRLPRLWTAPVSSRAAALVEKNAESLAGHITTFTEGRVRRRVLSR